MIREVPMEVRLAVCGNLLFAELPIKCAVEDIGNFLVVPRLAIPVPVFHLLRGRFIEKKCDKVRYDWQVLEGFSWLPIFIAPRFVTVGEWTTI